MQEIEVLMQQAKRGNQDAFIALVQPLEKQVYHLLLNVVGNKHDAEDAWQEAVINAWQGLSRLRSADRFKTWLCRIGLNEAHNILRKRARQPVLLEEWPDLPQNESGIMERYLQVHSYLQQLPLEQRTALVLRFWLDMSLAEMANAMVVPLSTAKTRLYTGMERIRELSAKEGESIASHTK